MPKIIPRSGPTEKLLGRFLFLFSWDLDGTVDHPTLGSLPFHFSLNQDKGNFSIYTEKGSMQSSWNGKHRSVKFDHTPLSLLPSFPAGEVHGEWSDSMGEHSGSVLVTLATGETIAFRGEGKKVLITSLEFKLEGDLNFELPSEKTPVLTLSNGIGKMGKYWGLKEVYFDSAKGGIDGKLYQLDSFPIASEASIREGSGVFHLDILEKKLVGHDFEAILNFLNEDKKALFPYWEADRDGGAFEAWIENDGLIKGIYRKDKIHIFEGSFLNGIEMGPLVLTQDKLEGSIKSDLGSLLKTWSRWSLFELPSLPILEGKLDGEILLTPSKGECRLTGENLKLGNFPVTSTSLEIALEPNALHLKEGAIEECIFSFDLIKKGSSWEMPTFALLWRDFLRGTATGNRTDEGIFLTFDHVSADLTVLEAFPPLQEILHRFDLTGYVKGFGNLFYADHQWKGSFKWKGEEWMSGEKAFPMLKEMTVEFGDEIKLSGGSFQLDKQLLTLTEGIIDENGVTCAGVGNFAVSWLVEQSVSGPWQYKEGIFSGVVDVPHHGLVHWKKDVSSPLTLWNPLYNISCELEENGNLKGTWGNAMTFEMLLEGDGKGEGKAKFLGLPIPKVPIQSPLPLEMSWIYPSTGTLPFRLFEGGLLIVPGGEIFSEGKGVRYEKVEGFVSWNGELNIRLLPKAARLPLYWLERGELAILGTIEEPKVEVKWR